MFRRLRRIAVLCVLFLAVSASGRAATIHVRPEVGTLQAALDAADSGDTIRVHAGTYSGTIQVTKSLRIVGDGAADVMIDGGCGAETALEILADNVVLKGVTVTGGTLYALDMDDRDRIAILESTFLQSCGSEEYGVNVFHSTRVRVIRNQASGYEDAGIYIGGTDPDAHVIVAKNTCSNNYRGITVEDVQAGGENVIIDSNRTFNNVSAGIIPEASDGVRILHNIVRNNLDVGILLDDSDDNRIIGNKVSGSVADLVDHGVSNCWKQNTYTSGTPEPAGCP